MEGRGVRLGCGGEGCEVVGDSCLLLPHTGGRRWSPHGATGCLRVTTMTASITSCSVPRRTRAAWSQ